jgi:hypothetical protein
VLSDPLSISYDGSAKSLARVSVKGNRTVYRTADREFEMSISKLPMERGQESFSIRFSRMAPDPTPSNAFDPYRSVVNSFELGVICDESRFETSTVVPLLRSALNSFVDSSMLNRLIAGEK